MLPTTENEKTSLEAHVDLCALRYSDLDTRLGKVEAKLDAIDEKIDRFKDEIAWLLIKGGFGVIVALVGSIATILKLFGHW
jgi:hypothetical protein